MAATLKASNGVSEDFHFSNGTVGLLREPVPNRLVGNLAIFVSTPDTELETVSTLDDVWQHP